MKTKLKWEKTARGARLVRTEVLGTTTTTKRGVNWKRADERKGSAKSQRAARRAVELPASALASAPPPRSKATSKHSARAHAPELTGPNLYAVAKQLPASARFGSATFLGPLLERFGTTPKAASKALWKLQQNGEITLARADLVEAMNPEVVRASELTHPSMPSVRMHFLRPLGS